MVVTVSPEGVTATAVELRMKQGCSHPNGQLRYNCETRRTKLRWLGVSENQGDAGMTIAAIDFQMLANAGYPPTRFAAGDVIFAEGDKGDAMYVVRSGEVVIEHQRHVMETLGEAVSSVRWP